MKPTSFLVGLAALVGLASAECPGGCSGNGVCGPRDMCYCFKNYAGNDCAQRVCPFGFAHIDTPKGDLNMDRNQKTTGWILDQSQVYPYKTYEWFNPDAKTDEAHFYMECSNMGICDRATGICGCFPGFEGSACQRAQCANNCNGRGVCKSISEIAATADANGKLTGNPGGQVATKYNLWDANVGHSCVCDPWFTGGDCSRRNCKVGVDPLYMAAGFPVLETFIIYTGIVPASTHLDPVNSWYRLRVFDNYGAGYLTDRIPIYATADGAKAVEAIENAFLNIPNDVFSSIDCELVGTAGTLGQGVETAAVASEEGTVVVCQYIDNPGDMRLPEVADSRFAITGNVVQTTATRAFVAAGDRRGENREWITTPSVFAFDDTTSSTTILLIKPADPTTTPASAAPINTNSLIKIRDRHLLVASVQTTVSITVLWPYTGAAFADYSSIFYSTSLTVAADATAKIVAWAVGSDTFEIDVDPTTLVVGSRIFYHNVHYFVRSISLTTTPKTVTVDRKFNGQAADGTAVSSATDDLFIVSTPNPATGFFDYVSECSGRGMCSRDTGICACFKGYTDDNCNNQNILAF
ncbi:hypothetical protein DYB30_009559 [Aphanomyces astaci]|uniref:EGF-like domain-containing protein n=1 Tax=Aphanomyces astaci TaxID=112090 RepID=A0A397CNI1_APHAT|nr:hypothetical protein DYB30_009559 [Aphanomyces astaci]